MDEAVWATDLGDPGVGPVVACTYNPLCQLEKGAFSEQVNSTKTAAAFPPSWVLCAVPNLHNHEGQPDPYFRRPVSICSSSSLERGGIPFGVGQRSEKPSEKRWHLSQTLKHKGGGYSGVGTN